MQRIAIIGSSGFYGRAMVREFRDHHPDAHILGIDVLDPPDSPPDEFAKLDVRDPALNALLSDFKPDTVLHFAFIVNPMHNYALEEDINVNGTKNVLSVIKELQPERFLVSSSATAYGAWPDNPIPIHEDWPLRARHQFPYARHKTEIDQSLYTLASDNPEIAVSWTRPTVIIGPGISNYLTNLLLNTPLIALPGWNDTPIQLVDLDEVASATRTILKHNGRGPYNLAPDDWLTLKEIAKATNRYSFPVPLSVAMGAAHIWWALRLPVFCFPPAFWYYLRYSWAVKPARLKNECGFEFQQSTRDCLDQLVNSRK